MPHQAHCLTPSQHKVFAEGWLSVRSYEVLLSGTAQDTRLKVQRRYTPQLRL